MPFQGNLERADQFAIQGWVYCDSLPSLIPFVDIVVNRRFVASVRAGLFRQDLLTAGMADGRRAFSFNPYEILQPGPNHLEVLVSGTDQHVRNGVQDVVREAAFAVGSPSVASPLPGEAAVRWFRDQVSPVASGAAVLEVGPGGLWSDAAERVDSYERLGPDSEFDVAVCSGQSEAWMPSIAEALRRIYAALEPGGFLFLDFACEDADCAASFATVQAANFRRVYSQQELRIFFLEAGFELMDIKQFLNSGGAGRALVTARKPEGVS